MQKTTIYSLGHEHPSPAVVQKVDFSYGSPMIQATESKIFIYPVFYPLDWSICSECLPPADFGEWETFSCSTVWLLKMRWSEENCLFVFVVRRPLKYLWPFLCRLQPFVLWITHLRARHWFWMPKSAFLLASCLQNGITCSLVQRLINPCGKLVFHNAECLEESVREWAISSFRDSLGWPAVKAGIAGEVLLQSCLVRNSPSMWNLPATVAWKSMSGGLSGNCVGKNVSRGLDLFSLLSSGSSVAKRLFQVFV